MKLKFRHAVACTFICAGCWQDLNNMAFTCFVNPVVLTCCWKTHTKEKFLFFQHCIVDYRSYILVFLS